MKEHSLSEFADEMNLIMPVLMKEIARQYLKELNRVEITLPQFLILDFLHREGGSKMTTLANVMHVSTAAMTGIVNRLVEGKYLQRTYKAEDRRVITMRPTARGNALVKNMNAKRRAMVIDIFGKISAADRENYLRVLTQIKKILVEREQR